MHVAPHSPQRKRFDLRMKSFSMDSPDSPVVAPVLAAVSAYTASLPRHSTNQQQQQQYEPSESMQRTGASQSQLQHYDNYLPPQQQHNYYTPQGHYSNMSAADPKLSCKSQFLTSLTRT